MTMTDQQFWEKVDGGDDDECWEWQGRTDKYGYGRISSNERAPRIAYRISNGDIPEDHEMRHKCDNPTCCNPAHLTTGTRSDNMRDKCKRGRQNSVGTSILTNDEVMQLRMYYAQGVSQNVLADKFGISQANVSQIVRGVRRGDLPVIERGESQATLKRGDDGVDEIPSISEEVEGRKEKYQQSNLTPDDVREIRKMSEEGYSCQEIAYEFDMAQSHINSIINGHKWGWVE